MRLSQTSRGSHEWFLHSAYHLLGAHQSSIYTLEVYAREKLSSKHPTHRTEGQWPQPGRYIEVRRKSPIIARHLLLGDSEKESINGTSRRHTCYAKTPIKRSELDMSWKIIRLVALALLLLLVRGWGSQQRPPARTRYTSEFRQLRLSCACSGFGFCLESGLFHHFADFLWIRRVDYVFIFIVVVLIIIIALLSWCSLWLRIMSIKYQV